MIRIENNPPAFQSPLTTKGDLFARSASGDARLAPGAVGQVLTADPSQPDGMKWAYPDAGFQASTFRVAVGLGFGATTGGTVAGTSQVTYFGKATAAFTQCDVRWAITAAMTAVATWAEIACCKGAFPSDLSAPSLTAIGSASIAADLLSIGAKQTTFALSGVSAGDDLWLVIGRNGGTGAPTFVASTLAVAGLAIPRLLAPQVATQPSLLNATPTSLAGTVASTPSLLAVFS